MMQMTKKVAFLSFASPASCRPVDPRPPCLRLLGSCSWLRMADLVSGERVGGAEVFDVGGPSSAAMGLPRPEFVAIVKLFSGGFFGGFFFGLSGRSFFY